MHICKKPGRKPGCFSPDTGGRRKENGKEEKNEPRFYPFYPRSFMEHSGKSSIIQHTSTMRGYAGIATIFRRDWMIFSDLSPPRWPLGGVVSAAMLGYHTRSL